MSHANRSRAVAFLLLVALTGCRGGPAIPERATTGAAATAERYFAALIASDWPTAYAALDTKSRAECSAASFTERARSFHKQLGFEPTAVHLRACDEHGDSAIAHVSIKGSQGASTRIHKDAVGLRHSPAGWSVVLPVDFGKRYTKS
jgi:hypothetical protein